MDIETLQLFIDVMRLRSFTSVASNRGIAASSVSRSIRSLEEEVGTRLFQRTTRAIKPTEAGLLYFERIRPAFDELQLAKQLAKDINEKPQGRLTVSAPSVFGEMYIVPLIPEFSRLFPDLSLDLLLQDRMVDLVEERVDIAIRVGTLQDSSYIAKQLMPMEFFISASPGYLEQNGTPTKPEQVKEHNCLLFPRSGYNFNWIFEQGTKKYNIDVQGRHMLTRSQAIKQCTVAGLGLSLLPDWLIRTEIESGALLKLFKDYRVSATDFNSAVWMLYPSKDYLPTKVRLFKDFIVKSFNK